MGQSGAGGTPNESEYDLVRILAEAATVEDAARRLLELIGSRFGWRVGALWAVDEEERLLRHAEDWSAPGADVEEFRRISRRLTFARGVGLPGRVWASGEPAWVVDVAADPNFPRVEAAAAAGLHAAVAIPVVGPAGVLGVMEFFARELREPDPAQVELMRTVGRQMGQYLARAAAERRALASEEVSASIVRAALDCIVTMDHEGRVIDLNPAAEATFGYTAEEARGRLLAELVIPPEYRDAHHRALTRYVATGQPTIMGRRLELEALRADAGRFPVELTIARLGRSEPPLFTGFVRDITDRRRGEQEVERLLEREHQARLRAEEAERSTRRVAETLQRTLLPPHLPAIPGVDLGAAYRSAAEGSLVGGDFYDVFPLGGGRWGLVIGDVRGKGAYAASVTALVRYSVRAAALLAPSPREVLSTVNETLLRDTEAGDFCTVIYAVLEVGDATPALRLAIAGHPLPLLAGRDGVSAVGRPGTLLGAVPDPVLEDHELRIGAGQTLLLYTDGVTESRTPDGLFGVEGLAAVLAGCAGQDAAGIARRVESAVAERPGHRATDDVAVVAVQAPGAGV